MLCPNGTVKPFLVSLVEPVAYLLRNSDALGCGSFNNPESQLGGFPLELCDL